MITPLPEPIKDQNGRIVLFVCPICGAINLGDAPHGMNQPCPIAIAKHEREMDAHNRADFMSMDLAKMMKKMGVDFGEDEDE